jgi:prepilin-type N-terminal cleavage/methylation domain-containing protein
MHTCTKRERDVKRRAFSLIEVMVALVLLAVCGAVCTIQFKASYDERRTKNVLQLIEGKLQQALTIARVTRGEVIVAIDNSTSPPQIYFEDDVNVSEKIKLLLNKKEPLDGVSKVELEPDHALVPSECTRISFHTSGIEFPKSQLKIYIDREPLVISLEKYAEAFAEPTDYETTQVYPDAVTKAEKENVRSP